MAQDKTILSLEVRQWEDHEGNIEMCIDILRSGYNIIEETIYNDEIARQVIEIINNNRRDR